MEIFVEHTNEDQWNYDAVHYEGGPILHDEEGFVDVDVIKKSDESDSTTEESFDDTMPHVAHRFCVRHLHTNFKTKDFGGQTLKDVL
ncbi:hypothetical protein RDI58_024887 [Solanum bulbocastanum]|uniref:Uncharacterized protein n=1 Tax=Solanum bulbocastanum TaxID=147425 RepID=A0AAN8SZ33_SOLBU